MITLGIEGSANKLGISILSDTEIISNLRSTFHNEIGQGFKPSELAANHSNNIFRLIKQALKESNISLKDIDLIAYTRGPGIAAPLNVCSLVARTLALKLNCSIIGVNHCVAHIEMGRFVTGMRNPVVLYASGANTQIICYNEETDSDSGSTKMGRKPGRYSVLGEALDVAVGNCLDKIARLLKIENDPSPGYNIEQHAKQSDMFIPMPVSVKGMGISCSGIVEHIRTKIINNRISNSEISDSLRNSICFSVQENLFAALVEVTERAMSLFKSDEVLIVGGVGCNLRLQEMITIMCKERNARVGKMDDTFCVDNGAMIGYTGYKMFNSELNKDGLDVKQCDVTQRFRTESVEVDWD